MRDWALPSMVPLAWLSVAAAMRLADVLHADAVRGQRGGIGADADGEVLLAADQHLGDAGNRRDLLREDGEGVVVDLVDRQVVGMDGVDQHRLIGRR